MPHSQVHQTVITVKLNSSVNEVTVSEVSVARPKTLLVVSQCPPCAWPYKQEVTALGVMFSILAVATRISYFLYHTAWTADSMEGEKSL